MMRIVFIIWISAFFIGCSEDASEKKQYIDSDSISLVEYDTLDTLPQIKVDGLSLFIDSFNRENYYIDTNRLKKIPIWYYRLSKSRIKVCEKHIVIEYEFPVVEFRKHLSNPKTYFLAQWNTEDSTFKNGDDLIIMTWRIDSMGIEQEEVILKHLIWDYWGLNLPCYTFRNDSMVYAIAQRSTCQDQRTKRITENLKNYINKESHVYGHADIPKLQTTKSDTLK